MKIFYSDDYVSTAHSIDATKKPKWVADSLRHWPIPKVDVVAPSPATIVDLQRVHSIDYIRAVQTGDPRELAESSTFPWDCGVWAGELAHCGGMIAAARCALTERMAGSLNCGFHHARYDRGKGHCVFNGLALAALVVRDLGVEGILHIDVDAHCGGGTYSILGTSPAYRQVDVSLFATDYYKPTEPSTLDMVDSSAAYLNTIQGRLNEIGRDASGFQLCIYYAGMDPHEGCAFGGLPGIDDRMLRQRDELIFDWLVKQNIPCAFSLGGGYIGPGLDRDGLVSLHRGTIEQAAASMS